MAATPIKGATESVINREDAEDFLKFVDGSPSPFHAVRSSIARLEAKGFKPLRERDEWNIEAGGKYYVTRNQSTLFAFAVGAKWVPGNGFSIVAAHTDSCCLKVKPVSKVKKGSYLTVGVELYGGGLWYTWFDRDLSLAGRVVVKDGESFKSCLVKIDRPIMRVPTLAIHISRVKPETGLKFNSEDHMGPVLTTVVKDALNAVPESGSGSGAGSGASTAREGNHHPALLGVIAEELGCAVGDICDFDLCLYDTQPAAIGGVHNEFIFAARLDNLMMSYCSVEALARSCSEEDLADDNLIRLIGLFDNEEVGSGSMMGAGSSMMREILERISGVDKSKLAVKRSLLVSADMAHAVHPHYAHKHEHNHQVEMHKGMVIKNNANQRYATTSLSAFIIRRVAELAGVPVQDFVVRQDCACGSTIGPMLSKSLGMRTVDVGLPQLSMHSIREMGGTDDVSHGINLFVKFFNNLAAIDATLDIGE